MARNRPEFRRLLRHESLEVRRLLALTNFAAVGIDSNTVDALAANFADVAPVNGDIAWDPVAAAERLTTLIERHADDEVYHVDNQGNLLVVDPSFDLDKEAMVDANIGAKPMAAPEFSPPASAPYPLDQTFLLHSLPGASKTIYLDFTGHVTTGQPWNGWAGVDPIVTPPYNVEGGSEFSTGELEQIQQIWERVAEDFLPFHVNVTTEEPPIQDLINSGGGDTRWGVRVVTGPEDWMPFGAGGVAYVGSFNWDIDGPVFVFNTGVKAVVEAISHEVGHALGLSHDGTGSEGYYTGHGEGATGWAPIMGVGYYRELSQWSRGEYSGANNTEDDLQIITTQNGFTYRTDDHGNSIGAATALTTTGLNVFAEGIIERRTDLDYFSFTTSAGPVSLEINPFYVSPNLDILARLYDASGSLIATSNPVNALNASFDLELTEGTYYLSIDGTGKTPTGGHQGYSDYGSLGFYTISGSIAAAASVSQTYVYHRDSSFDSGDISTALDTTKSLALETAEPITLGFSNLINSSRGINGLVFDIENLPSTLSASDFVFQVSPTGVFDEVSNPPVDWGPAPVPSSISVVPGATSRVLVEWPESSIVNRWLRITLKANANTGLEQSEVYYLGHLLGETTGADGGVYTVSFADINAIRGAVGNAVDAGSIADIDKTGTVSFADINAMRPNVGSHLTNITIGGSGDSMQTGLAGTGRGYPLGYFAKSDFSMRWDASMATSLDSTGERIELDASAQSKVRKLTELNQTSLVVEVGRQPKPLISIQTESPADFAMPPDVDSASPLSRLRDRFFEEWALEPEIKR